MNNDSAERLAALAADYAAVRGRPFENFFCPVLFRDEPAPLSQAHIVNKAFSASSRRWTIQRTHVDNFFGAMFEADFVLLEDRGKHDLIDILTDRDLSRRLHPKILLDGVAVPHYLPKGAVPPAHSEFTVDRDGRSPPVRLALKLEPSDVLAAADASWEVTIERDVRLPALVSLLKAAHLTLFELIGYQYALSSGGRFLGWDVLGKFANDFLYEDRSLVRPAAANHFREFINLVRPMIEVPSDIEGTISDGQLYLCSGTPVAWAFIVFVRAGNQFHAVIVPVLEDDESAARLVRFLEAPSARFEVRLTKFAGDRWEVAKTSRVLDWPEARFSE